ncbi:nucleotide-diphospho-sugar transferase [Calocera cornea HHB12733]|uniref:Translation initiation factor eIF2B subunit epsilon n=1 Tax=Calocera cornea HHB12733 TaxID=1353952 RepID=A0A165IEP0_9BASI|nr:nucleotide-diphospho-sugar transferase [Calocera cornea HHB12733]
MPPKDTQRDKGSEEEEVLQAVVLADSFNTRFKPLTLNTPRCLLPICNVPMLLWTFESLALAGVEQIFVFCNAHSDQVKEAIQTSRFSQPSSGVHIVPIVSPRAMSVGDAMRELDEKQLISSDFILVAGDVVSNLQIDEVVKEHKERRKKNKDAIMTMVVKRSGAFHRTRPVGDASVFVLDPTTSECVHYESILAEPAKRSIMLPREVMEKHHEVEVRNDLIDCSIDVCSVDVPVLFSENFDYQDLRRDFVHGVLTSDLLGKSIYCHVVEQGYAARVRDTKSYAAVSKDIISRWTFPLVPGDNLPGGDEYEYRRGNRYISKDNVMLSRTCTIGNDTIIGPQARIHDNVRIENSVIGPRCSIGPGTIIRDSFIWDDAYVDAGCTIEGSIIGQAVHIGTGSTIKKGCLIAEGTKLGPKAVIGEFKRISREKPPADEEEEEGEEEIAEGVVNGMAHAKRGHFSRMPLALELGEQAEAYVWPDTVGADVGADGRSSSAARDADSEDEETEAWGNLKHLRLGMYQADISLSWTEYGFDPYFSDTDSSDDEEESSLASPASGVLLTPSGDSIPDFSLAPRSSANFRSECVSSLERALAEGHTVDDAAIELKTLRMASNVTMTEVRDVVIEFVVGLVKGEPGSAAQKNNISPVVERWAGLITNLMASERVEMLLLLQVRFKTCARLPNYLAAFKFFLYAFYNEDIVEASSIRAWLKDPRSREAMGKASQANMEACWKQGAHTLAVIEADEEDSEEEDEEDDSE